MIVLKWAKKAYYWLGDKLLDLDRKYMNYIRDGHSNDCKCDYHKDKRRGVIGRWE